MVIYCRGIMEVVERKEKNILRCLSPPTTPKSRPRGKLNIAHHKSYHPYRRDNIEKVRRDEEEVRLKEAKEEGRMSLAVRTLLFVYTKTKVKTRILKHESNRYVSAPVYRTSLQRRSGGTTTT